MKLTQVKVQLFRNILDSSEVSIEDDVTCLVGKNESGKTAFLKALLRLNPAQGNREFKPIRHYPAWLEKRHRRQGADIGAVKAVTTWFKLDDRDKESLDAILGDGVIVSDEITVGRTYNGTKFFRYNVDESKIISNLIDIKSLPQSVASVVGDVNSVEDLQEILNDLLEKADDVTTASVERLSSEIEDYLNGHEDLSQLVISNLDRLIPDFFYFSEYSKLPGTVKIRELLEADDETLNESQRTAKSLLMMAGAEDDYLLTPDYEERKRELENVANSITADVLRYWTTNPELRVEIDITTEVESNGYNTNAVVDELHFRMRDDRHMLSLPFEERSSGFQWFFSFLAAFSEYENSDKPVVILLDEPGIGLHARAQSDFLRFIDDQLAKSCQVIYTTHSPFMIQSGKLERTRLIEDHGPQKGAIISKNVLATDPDTLFPLQGALGYDLAQNLFIGPDNLVVEGTSDYTYLSVLSDHLIEKDREGLDPRWTIIPVGGADLVPTFVALLGGKKLDFTVLLDSRTEGHQKIQSLIEKKYVKAKRIITIDQVLRGKSGDIEDVFDEEDYLTLYNKAFTKELKASDIQGKDPLVKRIARREGGDFNHGKPADVLLRYRNEFLPQFSDCTLNNFESCFSMINKTLSR